MFIIRKISTDECFISCNPRTDDVVQFFPEQYSTTQGDLEIYIGPEALCMDNCANDKALKARVDNGSVVLEEFDGTSSDPNNPEPNIIWGNLIGTHPIQQISWPYDQDGNYIVPAAYNP